MGSWQQTCDNSPPQGPYDPPQHETHLPFRGTRNSDSAMNSANPFLPSPADTVVDMPRDAIFHHDSDFHTSTPGEQGLFSDSQMDMIHGFFQLINSDGSQNLNFAEGGLNFSDHWAQNFQQPAPTVLGYQTHPPNTSVDAILSSYNLAPHLSAQAHAPPLISPEVFGAAQALSRPSVHSHHQYDGLQNMAPTTMAPPLGDGPSHQYSQYSNGQRQDSVVNHQMLSNNSYTEMYDSIPPAISTNNRTVVHPEIQFGTDRNFTGGNFNPTEANIEGRIFQDQNAILGCLQPNMSAAPTRASSPQPNGRPAEAKHKSPLKLRTTQEFVPPITSDPDSRVEPPKKRRRSKPKMSPDADETAEFSRHAPAPPPRLVTSGSMGSIPESAVKNENSPVEGPPSVGGKRRRGGPGAAKKPPRQNLTDAQKRENHIKSEQKRRTQIREAFQDVEELVPSIKGANFSKSVILNTTAEYLLDLLQKNELLKQQLAKAGISPTPLQKSRSSE